jgi:hypothetical protein
MKAPWKCSKCGARLLGLVITQAVEGVPSRTFLLCERPLKILSVKGKRAKKMTNAKKRRIER